MGTAEFQKNFTKTGREPDVAHGLSVVCQSLLRGPRRYSIAIEGKPQSLALLLRDNSQRHQPETCPCLPFRSIGICRAPTLGPEHCRVPLICHLFCSFLPMNISSQYDFFLRRKSTLHEFLSLAQGHTAGTTEQNPTPGPPSRMWTRRPLAEGSVPH